jgi:hypothetical protein
MSELERQSAKERAVRLALCNDRALIRENLEVYAIRKDGSREFVSESSTYGRLWQDALTALRDLYGENE